MPSTLNTLCNPFIPAGHDYGAVDSESRLRALKDFDLEQCRAALALPGLQKTVEKKLQTRIRKLEKLAETAEPSVRDVVPWKSGHPTLPGAYYVRGFRYLEPDSPPALVEVADDNGELVCNINEYNTFEVISRWSLLADINEAFEWLGPLQVPVADTAPKELCQHVFTDDGMFTVDCTKCGLRVEASPSNAVMDLARQLAFDVGGVAGGSFLLTGDDFDQVVSEACAMAVIEYASAPAQGE